MALRLARVEYCDPPLALGAGDPRSELVPERRPDCMDAAVWLTHDAMAFVVLIRTRVLGGFGER